MITLPLVELDDDNDIYLKKYYPSVGRYVIKQQNGDVSVVDVYQMKEDLERVQLTQTFIGQPELHDEEEFVLRGEIDAVKSDYEVQIEDLQDDLKRLESAHKEELERIKAAYKESLEAMKADCATLINQKTADMRELADQQLAMEREKLNDEYERKKMQLELETPKRFAQGEWVSGKTLTEIVKTLVGRKEE